MFFGSKPLRTWHKKQHTIKAYLYKGEKQYVTVVTQGKTVDEALKNLQEAVSLHLEGEDLKTMGFAEDPNILVTMEI